MKNINPHRKGREQLALSYVSSVANKIASGEYATEATKCFCGSDNDRQLMLEDRYGLPHRYVICNDCALMRANPRMTAEAYKAFYNNEYRYINFPTFANETREQDREGHYQLESRKGTDLQQMLTDFDIEAPKVVVDWGCYAGGMLQPFKNAGAKTYGIEIDAVGQEYARENGHEVVSSIDELIAMGVKADLVIMQDVIEHLTDLHEVAKVKEILSPNGHLYVWTPGFFRHNVDWYFQLAHTYQFCQHSLEYVMTELGFSVSYCDEECTSLWTTNKFDYYKVDKPASWVEYITDHLFKPADAARKMPRFRGVCKFSRKLLFENIDQNLAAKFPDISEIANKHSGDVICIGGGPSVDAQLETIRELHDKGTPIIAIARMNPWLLEHGIVPDYVISLDCSEEQEVCFERLCPATTYLLALVSRPSIFKRLEGEKCYVWSSQDNIKTKDLRSKHGYDVDTVINGGGSVAISCLAMGLYLGFNDFHYFGLDLMFHNNEQTHATGIAGESVPQNKVVATIKGEQVLTTPSFIDFANQTLDIVSVGHSMGLLKSIKFYGESLLNKLWDSKWHTEESDAH